MNANEVKSFLSENDIISLLADLGAEPYPSGNTIICKTVCHGGRKHKLIYYKDSKMFRCFTDKCGSMDIFGLVGRVMNLDFFNSFKYVCTKFGVSYGGSYESQERIDTSFFDKFGRIGKKKNVLLKKLNKKLLNTYHHLYHQSWIDEGISVETMKKFGIRFSILDNQIIIPHFDIDGNLIGVRARNLNKDKVEAGQKYMPVYYKKEVLKHPTGAALYGLNFTKEQVEKYKAIILFESEKSVLQLDSMLPEYSIGACISGSSLSDTQLDILNSLDIDEVIVALDKEYEEMGSQEERFYEEKVKSAFLDRIKIYRRVSVIWDTEGLLELKDSPTDKGLETFQKLFDKRILV